eukprot:495126_1
MKSLLYNLCVVIIYNKLCFGQLSCLENSGEYQKKYIEPVLKEIEDKGYTIREKGYLLWQNFEKDGASPSTTYGVWHFPNMSAKLRPSAPHTPNAMLFHASDAIIFTGCTAPYVTYIDFVNYVYSKYNYNAINGTNNRSIPVFASTGTSIHQYSLNVSNAYSTAPFNTITSMIITGDQMTYKDIYNSYIEQNMTSLAQSINLDYIPIKYFNFIPYNFTDNYETIWSYGKPADSLVHIPRIVGLHFNISDYNTYINAQQPCYWITAEKLVDNNSIKPRIPYTELYIRNETSGRTEFEYNNSLNIFINDTIKYFTSKYNMELRNRTNLINCLTEKKHNYYGFECYDNNINCQGDDRTEQYWSTHNGSNTIARNRTTPHGVFTLNNDDYIMLIGINHVATNFTIYDNVLLYCEENQFTGNFESIKMIENYQYTNSCINGNITTNVKSDILSKFYMIQVARPQNCELYGKNIPGICLNETIVPSNKLNVLNTLNLLNLQTMTRPSQQEIIPDIFLQFKIN